MSMEETKNKWWGYVHTSGSLQAKRYFGPEDIQEANESPFCKQVVGPFDAKDRDEALEIVKRKALSPPDEIS
jgi:hypothetical protein